MKRATLIFNPGAGSQRDKAKLISALGQQLEHCGIETSSIETTGPGTAGIIAASAIADGSEVVFACGGDGTVHEVVQGLAGTDAALGVIPMGTANALARNLGLSQDPQRALAQQINGSVIRIPVGLVTYSPREEGKGGSQRYFTVLAGAGPDGALVYSLLAGQKSSLGRNAYYAHAARLFVTRCFQPFRILYRPVGCGLWEEDRAVSAMCARVGDIGGLFTKLTTGSSLHSKSLRLSFLRPPGRLSLPSWFVSGQLGVHRLNPWLRTLEVDEFRCEPFGNDSNVHAQVDGEWLGRLPLSIRLVPDALSLLTPEP